MGPDSSRDPPRETKSFYGLRSCGYALSMKPIWSAWKTRRKLSSGLLASCPWLNRILAEPNYCARCGSPDETTVTPEFAAFWAGMSQACEEIEHRLNEAWKALPVTGETALYPVSPEPGPFNERSAVKAKGELT